MSASTVDVKTDWRPVTAVAQPFKQNSANEVSKLLTKNHKAFHIFFNESIGMHRAYNENAGYQLPQKPTSVKQPSKDLSDAKTFQSHMGTNRMYSDFLRFFESHIDTHGWVKTCETYLFSGSEIAEAMLTRLGAGVLHPWIHLGFGIEFGLPAIVAEGLATSACHTDHFGNYLREAARIQKTRQQEGKTESLGLADLYEEIRKNEKIMSSRSGVLSRASGELAAIAGKYHVKEEEVEARMKELVNVDAFLTASMQNPPHLPKLDFFNIHSHNATIFHAAALRHFKAADVARLLEMQARVDMASFVGYGMSRTPKEHLDWMLSFAPQSYADKSWEQLYEMANAQPDDGHVSKALRALSHADTIAETQHLFPEPIPKSQILPLARVMMKSVARESSGVSAGPMWVRNAGSPGAWGGVPIYKEGKEAGLWERIRGRV
ncbi:MAG: hypothetical protein Q9162_006371 [Coniocarpon cinnabarinum]